LETASLSYLCGVHVRFGVGAATLHVVGRDNRLEEFRQVQRFQRLLWAEPRAERERDSERWRERATQRESVLKRRAEAESEPGGYI
jgi:hypothetical protein